MSIFVVNENDSPPASSILCAFAFLQLCGRELELLVRIILFHFADSLRYSDGSHFDIQFFLFDYPSLDLKKVLLLLQILYQLRNSCILRYSLAFLDKLMIHISIAFYSYSTPTHGTFSKNIL